MRSWSSSSSDETWGDWSSKKAWPKDPPHEGRAAEAEWWNTWSDHRKEWSNDSWNAGWSNDAPDEGRVAESEPDPKRYKSQLGGPEVVLD